MKTGKPHDFATLTGYHMISSLNKRNKKQSLAAASVSLPAACACLLTLLAPAVNAELEMLDADSLSQITGRAGLTIDVETKSTIGEFEYVDAGSFYQKNIELKGINEEYADNIRARVDITDGTETLLAGFAEAAWLADLGYLDASETDVAWAISEYSDGSGGFGKQFQDGDLLIHISSTDLGQDFITGPVVGQEATNLENFKNAVDIHFETEAIGIRASDDSIETDLSTNLSIQAYLGYMDILVANRGNGYTQNTSDGLAKNLYLQDSYVSIDVRFRVEDLDIDRTNNATNLFLPDMVRNPGLTLRDMRIHNERGADTLGSFGYATFQSKIAAASNIIHVLESGGSQPLVDGHAIYDMNAYMDWDLPHISFGDTAQSIGQVYLTDLRIEDTSMVISAHK